MKTFNKDDIEKILATSIRSMEQGISIIGVESGGFIIAICGEGRTQDEVDEIARMFKVRVILLYKELLGYMVDFKVKYKSVSKQEFTMIRLNKVANVIDKPDDSN